jgi:hypothetical protein
MFKVLSLSGLGLVLGTGCTALRDRPAATASLEATDGSLAGVGARFLGRPYLGGTLDAGNPGERLIFRCDVFDCITFVETSLAQLRAERAGVPSAYPVELQRLRYRGGRRAGYASRLHYFSEWLQDNAARGHLVDLTATLGGVPDPRPLHFMTSHRAQYPALADAAKLQGVAAAEARLSATPRRYLPKDQVQAVQGRIREGDILGFTSAIPGLDVVHVGLATRARDGVLRVLHASSAAGCVQVSSLSLADYLMGNPRMSGLRVARPI